jgi:hypothetical protein
VSFRTTGTGDDLLDEARLEKRSGERDRSLLKGDSSSFRDGEVDLFRPMLGAFIDKFRLRTESGVLRESGRYFELVGDRSFFDGLLRISVDEIRCGIFLLCLIRWGCGR